MWCLALAECLSLTWLQMQEAYRLQANSCFPGSNHATQKHVFPEFFAAARSILTHSYLQLQRKAFPNQLLGLFQSHLIERLFQTSCLAFSKAIWLKGFSKPPHLQLDSSFSKLPTCFSRAAQASLVTMLCTQLFPQIKNLCFCQVVFLHCSSNFIYHCFKLGAPLLRYLHNEARLFQTCAPQEVSPSWALGHCFVNLDPRFSSPCFDF